jgi:transcriptional antiterminator RfaH
MPLLPLEPFVYPADLFVTASPANGEEKAAPPADLPWWAAHTRPRAEKALARNLLGAQVRFFLPLYRKEWRSRGGRQRSSYLPLFPGYLFLNGDDEARLAALQTNQIARLQPVPDGPRLHADLTCVYRMIQGTDELTPEAQLHPGAAVRIVEGSLAGLEGKILRRGRKLRFVVEVQFLQRGVSVEVEGRLIRPLEGGSGGGTSR